MTRPVPNTAEELMHIGLTDPRYIIESGFLVVNKDKQEVPFIFNDLQNEFYDNRTMYDDNLKASQIGFTTMQMAIWTVKFLLVPNSWSVSISYDADSSKRIFEKVDFFLKHLPPWLQPFYKPSKKTDEVLKNEVMNSRFYIGTAGAKTFGRGDTIHYAHLSEISRWTDNGKIATGILRAVPDHKTDGDIWIVKESTANGQGNYHHKEWKREEDGKSIFKPHFFPWWRHEEYIIKGAKIEGNYTEEEMHLIKRYQLNDERLVWRRKKINTLTSEEGHTPEQMFKQEFPSSSQEAFLFSGNPVFPAEKVQNLIDLAEEPAFIGNLVGVPPTQTLDETEQGWLRIFEPPTEKGQYVIFADVGQFSDFCVGTVLDVKRWRVVAKFRTVIRAQEFAKELNKLGYFYNTALIAVEINNMGQSTMDKLVDLKYPNIYMRQRIEKKNGKKVKTDEPGWNTTSKTKSIIIGHMQEILRTEDADIPDKEILGEMTTFIKKENGKMEASEGNYDDQVISVCGAFYLAKLFPFVEGSASAKTLVKKVRKFKRARSSPRFRR